MHLLSIGSVVSSIFILPPTPSHALTGYPNPPPRRSHLVEEPNDLARDVLPPGLLVVHDSGRGGEDNVAELTRGQQLDNPLLEIGEADVVAGRDDTGLVEANHIVSTVRAEFNSRRVYEPAVQLDNDLAAAVVVDLLELADITYSNAALVHVAKY